MVTEKKLKEIAKKHKLKNYSRLCKQELLDYIERSFPKNVLDEVNQKQLSTSLNLLDDANAEINVRLLQPTKYSPPAPKKKAWNKI